MAVVEVAVLYALCGVGCAVAVLSRTPRRVADAAVMLPLWPLLGPFLFLRTESATAQASPLLPTEQAVAPLRERLVTAEARLAEIDELLGRPAFDVSAIDGRIEQLESTGATPRAVASATSRKRSALRLARRRKALACELEELAELFLQLETQSEVVRLAGQADDSVSELVSDIQARLEAIDEINESLFMGT